jgi:GTP-binding protein
MRAIRAIEDCDVCLFMIDANHGIQKQDLSIFSVIERNKKGVVLLINKWDTVEKETATLKEYEDEIISKIAPFTDLPILFISALNKQRIHKALESAMEVFENRKQKIPTSKLNEVMLAAIEKNPPPAIKGKYVKIKYITQLPIYSPVFAFFCNLPQYIKDPYKRYLENQLRKSFNLKGVPIRIVFKKK